VRTQTYVDENPELSLAPPGDTTPNHDGITLLGPRHRSRRNLVRKKWRPLTKCERANATQVNTHESFFFLSKTPRSRAKSECGTWGGRSERRFAYFTLLFVVVDGDACDHPTFVGEDERLHHVLYIQTKTIPILKMKTHRCHSLRYCSRNKIVGETDRNGCSWNTNYPRTATPHNEHHLGSGREPGAHGDSLPPVLRCRRGHFLDDERPVLVREVICHQPGDSRPVHA